eukprot:COSAG06_NODE_35510_length_459_cov_1.002778_1_plen_94_part_00
MEELAPKMDLFQEEFVPRMDLIWLCKEARGSSRHSNSKTKKYYAVAWPLALLRGVRFTARMMLFYLRTELRPPPPCRFNIHVLRANADATIPF